MHTHSSHPVCTPCGLSFPVHELVFVRGWAASRGLTMRILLDQVRDGAEFEEVLVLRRAAACRSALTLWPMAGGGVVAQGLGGTPRVFGGIHCALSHAGAAFAASPARAPGAWRRLLGWGRG